MGKLTDYTAEKVKNGKVALGHYAGSYLIKGFWNIGVETYKTAFKKLENARSDIDISDAKNESNNTDDIEKWLEGNGKIKKPKLNFGEGEQYLKVREAMGLNLMEIDKYYTNLFGLCLFFLALTTYCFYSGFHYIFIGKIHFWLLTYFLTGFLFLIFYLYYALDSASILHRKHIKGKDFLKTPSLWIPRWRLPYDWRIKD